MTKQVLLLGRTPFDQPAVEAEIGHFDVTLAYGTSLADVEAVFARGPVAAVIMGAGIALRDRLAIVEHIFDTSDATTVHMKDRASGRSGMLAFVKQVLSGLSP